MPWLLVENYESPGPRNTWALPYFYSLGYGVLVDIHSMYLHTAGTIEIVQYQLQYLTKVLEWLWSYLFNNFSIAWVILAPSSPISLGIKKSPEFLH